MPFIAARGLTAAMRHRWHGRWHKRRMRRQGLCRVVRLHLMQGQSRGRRCLGEIRFALISARAPSRRKDLRCRSRGRWSTDLQIVPATAVRYGMRGRFRRLPCRRLRRISLALMYSSGSARSIGLPSWSSFAVITPGLSQRARALGSTRATAFITSAPSPNARPNARVLSCLSNVMDWVDVAAVTDFGLSASFGGLALSTSNTAPMLGPEICHWPLVSLNVRAINVPISSGVGARRKLRVPMDMRRAGNASQTAVLPAGSSVAQSLISWIVRPHPKQKSSSIVQMPTHGLGGSGALGRSRSGVLVVFIGRHVPTRQ